MTLSLVQNTTNDNWGQDFHHTSHTTHVLGDGAHEIARPQIVDYNIMQWCFENSRHFGRIKLNLQICHEQKKNQKNQKLMKCEKLYLTTQTYK